MKSSKYQEINRQQLKRKALLLYKTGLTLRQVGKVIDKSHEWVNQAVKEMENELNAPVDNTIDKN